MATSATGAAFTRDSAIEREAERWMNDPYEHFGYHNTRIHSLDRAEVEAVQLAAMNLRLAERRGQVQMLGKLADGQGIAAIDSLDAMAPLLMPHIPAMPARLAEVMGVDVSRVSLKAKTNEGMDAVGRREGIAAMAVATVERQQTVD